MGIASSPQSFYVYVDYSNGDHWIKNMTTQMEFKLNPRKKTHINIGFRGSTCKITSIKLKSLLEVCTGANKVSVIVMVGLFAAIQWLFISFCISKATKSWPENSGYSIQDDHSSNQDDHSSNQDDHSSNQDDHSSNQGNKS